MYKVIKEEFGEIYSGINPSEAKSVFSRHKDKGHNVYLLNGDDLMDKFECGGKVNKEAYADGGEIEEWKKYVLENSSWFDDETEEESTTNQIYLTTRENGNVGDEEVGQKDINEAKNIVKKVVAKFPKTQYEIEEVDEWVHLTLMPNKTNEQLADEKIEKKHNQTKKESSKLIAKALKIKEEKALEIIEDFSYAKEYYEKNKGSKSTLPNRAFRVYYSHGSPTIKFENAQQVFDFITKDDFAKDFYYSANPRNKVAIYLYGWDALRINFDKDARPILPNGETDWGSKGKVLTVYPFLEENIESEKDFTQKVDKVISDFIIAYKIYVLQDTGFVSTYADGGEIKNLMKASGYIYKNYYYDIPRFEKKYGFTPKPPYFDIRPNGLVGISKKGREVIKQDDLGVKRNWESIGVSSYADGGKVKWDIGQVIGNTGNDGEYYTMDGKVGWVERPSGIVGRIVDIKDGYYIINVAGSVDGRWIDKAKIKITDPYYDLNRYYADGGRIGKAKQRRISKLKHTISNLIKDIIELEEEKNSLDKTDSHYQEDYNDIIELINDDKRELKKKENILSRNESQTYRDYADGGEVDGWKDKIQKDDDGSGFILMKDAPPINYITETKPNGTKIYTLTPPIFSPQSINTSAYTILKLKQVKSGQWRGLYEFEDGRKEWLQINKPQGLAYIRDIDLYNDDKEGYPDMRYSGRVLEQHYGGIDIIDYFGWRSKMGDGGEVTSGAGANAIFDEVQDTLDALKEMLGIYGSSPEDIENKKSIQAQIDELTQKSTKAVKKVANVIPDPSEIEEIEIPKELEGEIIDWIDDINFDVEFEKGGAVYTTQEAELMITNIINQIGKYALGYGLAREFKASEEDGFLKLSFLTSGKNKKDVKINVLYSGDSDNYIIETIGNGKKKNYIDIGWDDLTPTIMAIADDIGGKRPQLKKGGKVANPMKGKVNRAISKSGGLSSFAFESFSGGLSEDQRKSALINKKILISHTKPIHSLLSQDTGENIFAINGYHSLRDGFVEEALEENSDKLNFEQQDKLADLFNEFVNKIRTTKN